MGVLEDGGKELKRAGDILEKEGKKDESHAKLAAWWDTAKASAEADKKPVQTAGVIGGQTALKLTSYVPMGMAVLYLMLILYFKSIGGYKALNVAEEEAYEHGK